MDLRATEALNDANTSQVIKFFGSNFLLCDFTRRKHNQGRPLLKSKAQSHLIWTLTAQTLMNYPLSVGYRKLQRVSGRYLSLDIRKYAMAVKWVTVRKSLTVRLA